MKKKEFIIQDLLSKIFQGQFIEGQIPNQRKLAEMYKVSRFTIQKAIQDLEEIGVVEVIQGSGMYINKKWVKNPLIFNSLTQTPYDRIESRMLSLEKSLASNDEKQIFQLSDGEEIWTFKRLRIVNFIIEQIELSKMPVPLFPDLSKEVVEHSIQKYVEKKGYCISHYISTYVPLSISKEQSHYLMCKKGTPAMQIINRGILENGVIYEYSDITAIDYSATYIRPFDREVHQSRID